LQFFFKTIALDFEFGLDGGVGQVDFGQRVVLVLQFLKKGHFFFFTGTVDLFHAVHFAHHGVVFTLIAHCHELVLALFDARGVVINLEREALLLILKVRKLVQNVVALGFDGGKALLKGIKLARGAAQVLLDGVDGVIDLLQLNKLLDLVKIYGIAHESPPDKIMTGQQGGRARRKEQKTLPSLAGAVAATGSCAASFLPQGCGGPHPEGRFPRQAPCGI